MATYSFVNTVAAISGPGGAFSLGYGSANADEGIEVTREGEKSTLTIGADGTPMFSLHAAKNGNVKVTLLKTSPVNALLMAMYDAQSVSSSLWGINVITVADSASGDSHACRQVAFKQAPEIKQQKDAGTNVWEFLAGYIDSVLGTF